jgi:hypothetical protein
MSENGMPFVMTEEMKAGLRERGFSEQEIFHTTPGRAWEILNEIDEMTGQTEAERRKFDGGNKRQNGDGRISKSGRRIVQSPSGELEEEDEHGRRYPFSGYAARAERDEVRRRFELIPFHDLRPSGAPFYLVKGIIPRTGIVLVWGPPKCGKSFWTFDLSMHVALGWQYRGRRVLQGPVVYCAFEGQEGFKSRAEAFRRAHEMPDEDAVPFFLSPIYNAKLVRNHNVLIQSIRAQIGTAAPVVVALDTLNRSIDGSESKDEDMGAYLSAADAIHQAFGCCVIIVHHCGIDGSRPRGHTSMTGTADAQIAVSKHAEHGVMTATVEFMKDGPSDVTLASRLEGVELGTDDDGDRLTSCVVVPVDVVPKKSPKLNPSTKLALQQLRELITDVGEAAPPSTHIPAEARVVSVLLWRENFYKAHSSDKSDTKRRAFDRAVERLQELHIIGLWSDMVWLPDNSGQVRTNG